MKVAFVSVLVLAAAASAMAYNGTTVTTRIAAAVQGAERSREPAALLLSGGLLLGLAGALKRLTA